jgi:hypothetical protein
LGNVFIVWVLRLEPDDLIGRSKHRHQGGKDSLYGVLHFRGDYLATTLDLIPIRLGIVILHSLTALFRQDASEMDKTSRLFLFKMCKQLV